jgi:hypothetical protein
VTGDEVRQLRAGYIVKATADDGSDLLLVAETSPSREELSWPGQIILTGLQLDLLELDPRAGLVAAIAANPTVAFHLVGEQ